MTRGWTTAAIARAELERLGGIRIAASVYAEWESGRRVPSDANLARLEAFYGSSPNKAASRDDVLAAAILEQTAAIREQSESFNRLAESIDRAASGVVGTVEGFDGLLRGLLVALAGQGPAAQGDDAPSAPGWSRGTPATGTGR